jgi:acyl carrier protein
LNKTAIYTRLEKIFQDVFEVPDLVLTPQLSAADVVTWDSLGHIILISTIEEEFDIAFSIQEVSEARNVGEFVTILENKLND